MTPKVTVGLMTHKENPWLVPCIMSLLNQSLSPRDIIVIDRGVGCYNDQIHEVAEVAKRFGIGFTWMIGKNDSISNGRRNLYKMAEGTHVLFADDDMTYHHDFLNRCIGIHPTALAGIGQQVQIYDAARFANVPFPFSELVKRYPIDLSAADGSLSSPMTAGDILSLEYSFGGTIIVNKNCADAEQLFCWAGKDVNLADDLLLLLRIISLYPDTKFGILRSDDALAHHFRRKSAHYDGARAIARSAAISWGLDV